MYAGEDVQRASEVRARAHLRVQPRDRLDVVVEYVGPHAVEIIHEVALAMRHKLTVRDIAETVHAHPTVSEVVKLAALDAAEKCGV